MRLYKYAKGLDGFSSRRVLPQRKKGGEMSYWSAGIAKISDVQTFVDASKGWAGDRTREYGATDINLMHVIFGGIKPGR